MFILCTNCLLLYVVFVVSVGNLWRVQWEYLTHPSRPCMYISYSSWAPLFHPIQLQCSLLSPLDQEQAREWERRTVQPRTSQSITLSTHSSPASTNLYPSSHFPTLFTFPHHTSRNCCKATSDKIVLSLSFSLQSNSPSHVTHLHEKLTIVKLDFWQSS